MSGDNVDLLVVGSGPVGASYARLLAESRPESSILMVELGPSMTIPPGQHISALPEDDHERVQLATQGPDRGNRQPGAAAAVFDMSRAVSARPGLHLLRAGGMPAASMASGTGGMGTYWGGAIPRPYGSERVPWLAREESETAVRTAERLLSAVPGQPVESSASKAVGSVLAGFFDSALPTGRQVGVLPCAGRYGPDNRFAVTSVANILASIPRSLIGEGHFELRPNTLCRTLTFAGARVTGAIVEHLPSRKVESVSARAVVVAADAFRTPQLLFASGVTNPALGRYLMDHPVCNAVVAAGPDLQSLLVTDDEKGLYQSTLYVPFAEPGHPFQAIVHQGLANPRLLRKFGLEHLAHRDGTGWVALSWSGRTWPRPENRVAFCSERTDWLGMPAMSVDFALSKTEHGETRRELALVEAAADALGHPVAGFEPRLCPPGTSLHYTGTVRLGEHDDGTSVCDPHSKVWSYQNLFVGGNGVIPVATTCNPTLTSVALAAYAIPELTECLA